MGSKKTRYRYFIKHTTVSVEPDMMNKLKSIFLSLLVIPR